MVPNHPAILICPSGGFATWREAKTIFEHISNQGNDWQESVLPFFPHFKPALADQLFCQEGFLQQLDDFMHCRFAELLKVRTTLDAGDGATAPVHI